MRVDGTYTFSGSSARLLAALEDAETLARAVPGCERLLQLGPAGDGTLAFEARVRMEDGIVTATVHASVTRTPARLRLDLRGYGQQAGPFEGAGTLDLVEREGHTVLAYALEVALPMLALERHAALAAEAQHFIRACCERLAPALRPAAETAADGHGDEQEKIVAVTPPRGRIIALRGAAREPAMAFGASAWTERALWMGMGLLLGVGLISLALSWLRRLEGRGE
jgi:carbon monoxide dehydrogenase subunit G